MKKMTLNAPDQGKKALNENEAKQFISAHGVPVVAETVAKSELQAVDAAAEIGYPLVLKGLGDKLMHKTELGLVHLNIQDEKGLKAALNDIRSKGGADLDGYLLQPYLQGKREFMAGLVRDRQFGPVVLFGLGGIMTEAIKDITFRLAPINEADIDEMLSEIRSKALFSSFRGEAKVNIDDIKKTLLGLSYIGEHHPEVREIDVNPLLADKNGNVKAVDALVVLEKPEDEKPKRPPVSADQIGYFFYPRPVAFVGASGTIGKWGHTLLTNVISGGYKGNIYLVNNKGENIAGRKVYKTVAEIPGEVDLAVVTVPAKHVPDLIPQFKEKGIKNMLLITSGFEEVGEEGKKLVEKLVKDAEDAGILILGPNTMGILNPHIHFFCTGTHVRPIPGSTAVVAQSGNMGVQLLAFSEEQGIGIRGFCGSGNEAMISIEDFIDAFYEDEKTKTVILYVESAKDGRRFYENAKKVGTRKPIVLLKGGESEEGNRAAASHTGAMSTDSAIFNAMCRQAGIVKVEQPMDLLDLAAVFSSLPLPKGNRAAIMTLGGGWGVVTADLCSKFGIQVPTLSDDIIKRIDRILPPYWSRSNPVDLVGENDNTIPITVLDELLQWDGCDAVINLGILGRKNLLKRITHSIRASDPTYSEDILKAVILEFDNFEKEYIQHITMMMDKYQKPVFGVGLFLDEESRTVFRVAERDHAAVFFPSPERAVKTFSGMYSYYKFLKRTGVS